MPFNDVTLTAHFESSSSTISGTVSCFNAFNSKLPASANILLALYDDQTLVDGPVSLDIDGGYFFSSGIIPGKNYTIRLWEDDVVGESWSWNNFKAVNATDALLIQYMNIEHEALLNFPWIAPMSSSNQTAFAKVIADLNSDVNISGIDALLAIRRFVGLIDRYPNNTPNFRLFGSGFYYPHAPETIFTAYGNYTESTSAGDFYYSADIVSTPDNSRFNIYYVASGDLNISYNMNSSAKLQKQIDYSVVQKAEIGELVEIPLRISAIENLGAFSVELYYDNSFIEIISVENYLSATTAINIDAAHGLIQLACFDVEGMHLNEQEVFLTLYARLLRPASMDANYLMLDGMSEFVDTDLNTINPHISSVILDSDLGYVEGDDSFELKAYPNPFTNETNIVYNLPENGLVQLVIYNILGQEVVRLVEEIQEVGHHSLKLSEDMLLGSSVYFYNLRFEGSTKFINKSGSLLYLK